MGAGDYSAIGLRSAYWQLDAIAGLLRKCSMQNTSISAVKSAQGMVLAAAPLRSLASASLQAAQHFSRILSASGAASGAADPAAAGLPSPGAMSWPVSLSTSGTSACFGGPLLHADVMSPTASESAATTKAILRMAHAYRRILPGSIILRAMSQLTPPTAPAAAPGHGPAAPAPKPGPKRPGFWAGLVAFFSGFGFLLVTPNVWLLAMVPVTIAIVLSGGLGYGAYRVVPGWIAGAIGPTTSTLGGVAAVAAEVTATLLAIMAALLIGFALAQPLSSPALERIVRRREESLGAPAWPPTSFVDDVLRSIQSVLVSAVFGLPLLGLLFLADLLIPGAVVVTFPLKVLVTAMLIAWDLCDYPLSLRGIPVLQRVSLIGRYLWPMLGFGVGLALLAILPCMLLLVLPAGVAGATRLVCEIERWEQHKRGGGHTPAALPL